MYLHLTMESNYDETFIQENNNFLPIVWLVRIFFYRHIFNFRHQILSRSIESLKNHPYPPSVKMKREMDCRYFFNWINFEGSNFNDTTSVNVSLIGQISKKKVWNFLVIHFFMLYNNVVEMYQYWFETTHSM